MFAAIPSMFEHLTVSDLLRETGPFRWLGLALGFIFFFLVFMNILNAWRARRSAPPAVMAQVHGALETGEVSELHRILEADISVLSQSIRAGLGVKGQEDRLDRALVLRAWSLLTEKYQWWPRCLGYYGLAIGAATAAFLTLDTVRFAVQFWRKISMTARPPYLGNEVQEFIGRLLVCGGIGTVLFALAVITGLIFSLIVRSARHRSSSAMVNALGTKSGDLL
jgi:hypothetical protein